jgi:hypothetical protein
MWIGAGEEGSLPATPAQEVYDLPLSIIYLRLELPNTLLGLCDGLIPRPEESYQLWCVMCDMETSVMRRPWLILCLVSAMSLSLVQRSPTDCGASLCVIWKPQ